MIESEFYLGLNAEQCLALIHKLIHEAYILGEKRPLQCLCEETIRWESFNLTLLMDHCEPKPECQGTNDECPVAIHGKAYREHMNKVYEARNAFRAIVEVERERV